MLYIEKQLYTKLPKEKQNILVVAFGLCFAPIFHGKELNKKIKLKQRDSVTFLTFRDFVFFSKSLTIQLMIAKYFLKSDIYF